MAEIQFHPEVKNDIEAAYTWYEKQAQGLGKAFIAELEVSYLSISEMPQAWPKFGAKLNRFILNKFPFSVIYKEASHHRILVLAIMHHSRRPGYWRNRK